MENKKKIMVIDDENVNLKLFKALLKDSRIIVGLYSNPEIAIDNMRFENYDLFVIDFNMPKITGLGVLKYMKQNEIHGIKLIVTATDDPYDMKECYKYGANFWICRPFENEHIKKIIYQYLNIEIDGSNNQ